MFVPSCINLCSVVFTALHRMQTRSYDENSVSLSVCLSVCLSNAIAELLVQFFCGRTGTHTDKQALNQYQRRTDNEQELLRSWKTA